MAAQVGLPEGFVLDEPQGLPDGFVLDTPQTAPQMSVGEDVARSAVTGLAKGIPNILDLGAAGVATLTDRALKVTNKSLGDVFKQYAEKRPISSGMDALLNTQEHKPQTFLGRAADFAGQAAATAPLAGASTLGEIGMAALGGAGSSMGGDAGQAVGGDVGRVAGMLAGGFAGASAANKIGTALTQPMKKNFAPALLGQNATGVDDVGKFSHIQQKLADNYGQVRKAEKAAWDNVRQQAAGKSIGNKALGSLQKDILNAQATLTDNDAAGVVDRIITRWGNMDRVPAEELIANRATLSKASMRNAGLRPIVDKIDETLNGMGINGMGDAIKVSKQRFQQFDDVAPIANAMGEYSTAADFGKAVFGGGSLANASKAAQRVKEVIRASGDAHLDVKEALDQAVVHRVLQTATSAGDETIWLDKAAREINGLRQKNPELWGMLSKDTQEGLSKLGASMFQAGKSGKMDKVFGYTAWGLNKIMSPLGVRQVVQKPSTTASQVRLSFDDVKKLMNMRPDEGRSALDAMGETLQKPLKVFIKKDMQGK